MGILDFLNQPHVSSAIVFVTACLMCGGVALLSRGIAFVGTFNDNVKMVRAAAQLRFSSWPSRMHTDKDGRAQNREYWVMALALVQRLTGDRTSDYPNVLLALGSHAASSLLLCVIMSLYWSPLIGLFGALWYLTSFWPYEVSIHRGHALLSQAWLLLAVLATQA